MTVCRTGGMLAAILAALMLASCNGKAREERTQAGANDRMTTTATESATFGGGCFWCIEAVFQQLRGVTAAVSGYAGGTVPHPTYEAVCTGRTGHAEVVQVTFDPAKIRYEDLLEVFWTAHDPTTPNRQGADVGTQYRSVIFTHSDRQAELAREYLRKLDASGAFDTPIVTEIAPLTAFSPAEDYHQEYFEQNRAKPYCAFVIAPKVEKVRSVFRGRVKPE